MMNATIQELWIEALNLFADPGIVDELQSRWPEDPNVLQRRIQLSCPPTFQPGYVGCRFFDAPKRLLIVGYNPGEGKLQSSQLADKALSAQLRSFADRAISLEQLSVFQSSHLIKWPVFHEKGIFLETGDSILALLPKPLRPSAQSLALLNLFPFKTVGNQKPLGRCEPGCKSLKRQIWDWLVAPTIRELAPELIVHYPDSDQYTDEIRRLQPKTRFIRVWHPSDYNVRTRPHQLIESWKSLAHELELDNAIIPSASESRCRHGLV